MFVNFSILKYPEVIDTPNDIRSHGVTLLLRKGTSLRQLIIRSHPTIKNYLQMIDNGSQRWKIILEDRTKAMTSPFPIEHGKARQI